MEFSINMELQIGEDLWIVHTAQLVYSNYQDLCSDSLHRMTSNWPDQKFVKRIGDNQNIENVAVPILCNAFVQLN